MLIWGKRKKVSFIKRLYLTKAVVKRWHIYHNQRGLLAQLPIRFFCIPRKDMLYCIIYGTGKKLSMPEIGKKYHIEKDILLTKCNNVLIRKCVLRVQYCTVVQYIITTCLALNPYSFVSTVNFLVFSHHFPKFFNLGTKIFLHMYEY